MPQYGKRNLLSRRHFAEFETAFGTDPFGNAKSLSMRKDTGEEGRFRRFSREWIAEQADNLDISWLKDSKDTEEDVLFEPVALAQEAVNELESALEELKWILEELGEEIEI